MKFPRPDNPFDGIARIRFKGCNLSPDVNQSTPLWGHVTLHRKMCRIYFPRIARSPLDFQGYAPLQLVYNVSAYYHTIFHTHLNIFAKQIENLNKLLHISGKLQRIPYNARGANAGYILQRTFHRFEHIAS